MPGPLAHLFLGHQILSANNSQLNIKDNYFLSGCLAPDAVHAKPNYERKYKIHSHLKEGISDSVFHLSENIKVYEQRINYFLQAVKSKNDDEKSFYLGYLCHLLVDSEFILSLWKTMTNNFHNINKNESIEISPIEIHNDVDGIDHYLSKSFSELPNIINKVEVTSSFDVETYVTKNEIIISKNWVINRIRNNEYGKNLLYLSEKEIDDFILETTKIIKRKMNQFLLIIN